MKAIAAILAVLFVTSWAHGLDSTCSQLLALSGNQSLNDRFYSLLVGSNQPFINKFSVDPSAENLNALQLNAVKEPVLKFNWTAPSGHKQRDYSGEPWSPHQPLVGYGRIMSGPRRHLSEFESSAFAHYSGRVQDSLIPSLKKVEELIPDDRLSYGIVQVDTTFMDVKTQLQTKDNPPVIIGTMRVYDGSSVDSDSTPNLPFQNMMRIRHIKSVASGEVDRLRRQGKQIFEIGKFSLDGEPHIMARARGLLELFLLRKYAAVQPDGLFYVHVASLPHVRLYRTYGLEVIETIDRGDGQKEYILRTTGRILADRLRERYGLSDIAAPANPSDADSSTLQ